MLSYNAFIRYRAPLWNEFHGLLKKVEGRDLTYLSLEEVERFASLYHAVLSDYSHLRSHFPGTRAHQDLHRMILRGHYHLRRPPRGSVKNVSRFFLRGYPEVVRECRPFIAASLAIFLFFALWGFVLTTLNPEFTAFILGPETLRELSEGNFWVDHMIGFLPPSVMATGIWINNVSVAVLSWGFGAAWGLGVIYLLGMNGIMLGSIVRVTAHYGMLHRLLNFIAGHGLLEIFLLNVACGSGLLLGWGFINPERMEWRESVRVRGKKSFLLLVGTLPWFVLLGFVESYFSPRAGIPFPLHAAVGITILAVYIAYVGRTT